MISILALRRPSFPRTGMACTAALLALLGAPAGAADITKGGSLYATHCAVCHGAKGAPPVMPAATDFRRVEPLMRPDMQVLLSIKNGKGAMPGYFGILRDQQILDVIAFLRTLS